MTAHTKSSRPAFALTPLCALLMSALLAPATYAATALPTGDNSATPLTEDEYSVTYETFGNGYAGKVTFGKDATISGNNFLMSGDSELSSEHKLTLDVGDVIAGSNTPNKASISAKELVLNLSNAKSTKSFGILSRGGSTLTLTAEKVTFTTDKNGVASEHEGSSTEITATTSDISLASTSTSPLIQVANGGSVKLTATNGSITLDNPKTGYYDYAIRGVLSGSVSLDAGKDVIVKGDIFSTDDARIDIKSKGTITVDNVATLGGHNDSGVLNGQVFLSTSGDKVEIKKGLNISADKLAKDTEHALMITAENAVVTVDGAQEISNYFYSGGFLGENQSITGTYSAYFDFTKNQIQAKDTVFSDGVFIDTATLNIFNTGDIEIKKTTATDATPALLLYWGGTGFFQGQNITISSNGDKHSAMILDYATRASFDAKDKLAINGDAIVWRKSTLAIGSTPTTTVNGGLAFYGDSQLTLADGAKVFQINNEDREVSTKKAVVSDALLLSESKVDLSALETTLKSAKTYAGFDQTRENAPAAARLLKGSELTLKTANVQGAVVVDGEGSTFKVAPEGTFKMTGDLLAGNAGAIDVTLGQGSTFEGVIDDWTDLSESALPKNEKRFAHYTNEVGEAITVENAGTAKLTMKGGTWTTRGWSTLSEVSVDAPSVIDMTKQPGGSIYAKSFKGTEATFRMAMGDNSAPKSMLYLGEVAADAKHHVEVVLLDGTDPKSLKERRFATTNGSTSDTLFDATSTDQGFLNLKYVVKHEAYNKDEADKNKSYNDSTATEPKPGTGFVDGKFGEAGQNWYLDYDENVTPPKPSDSGETILATARGTYWQSIDLDRLNKRMGDRRMSREGEDGLWVRLRHDRLGTNSAVGNFRLKNTMYQMGYEHTWQKENGRRLAGIAIDYRDGDADYRDVSGDGSNDRIGLTAYHTWLADNGWYYDAVLRWGRLFNEFKIQNTLGKTVKGNYHNHLWGASFEGGKKIGFGESPWFIEPQGQLQYSLVTSSDYTTTQGTQVYLDRMHSIVSRVGFRLGRDFREQTTQAYVKADWMHEWVGQQRINAIDKTTGKAGFDASINNRGSWYDVGFGVQTLLGKQVYVFADAEYQFGHSLEKTWALNTGVRWQF